MLILDNMYRHYVSLKIIIKKTKNSISWSKNTFPNLDPGTFKRNEWSFQSLLLVWLIIHSLSLKYLRFIEVNKVFTKS